MKPKIARKRAVFKANYSKPSGGKLTNFVKNDPFPPMCRKQMTYSGSYSLSVNSATTQFGTAVRWALNDPYDPHTGVIALLNTSAYGMTEMASLYNRMKVYGVKIDLLFYDPSTDAPVCGVLLLNPANGSLTIAGQTIDAISKRPMGWSSALSNTGSQKMRFTQYLPMHTAFNLTKTQFDADFGNTTSPTNSSPGSSAWIEIAIADPQGSATAKTVQFQIHLTMYTEFYQRKIYV